MILAIADVLSAADIETVRAGLANAPFVDGKTTAGWSAKLVKSNLQAGPGAEVERLRALVEDAARGHPVFALATRPKTIIGPLFSRYQPGHAYGTHVDDALIGGRGPMCRSRCSWRTRQSYDGGELIIDTASGEESFKLPAGSLVTYPATMLHRVAPVTRGERMVAAGWVRSYVRDPAHRELLFDLETARRRLFDREGKTAEGDLLAKCAANLMRLWCDD